MINSINEFVHIVKHVALEVKLLKSAQKLNEQNS